MCELIYEAKLTARKKYNCMAYEWISNSDLEKGTFNFPELRAIAKAKANKGKIIKGQKYIRQFMKDGGTPYAFRAIPELHDICVKYDIYEC